MSLADMFAERNLGFILNEFYETGNIVPNYYGPRMLNRRTISELAEIVDEFNGILDETEDFAADMWEMNADIHQYWDYEVDDWGYDIVIDPEYGWDPVKSVKSTVGGVGHKAQKTVGGVGHKAKKAAGDIKGYIMDKLKWVRDQIIAGVKKLLVWLLTQIKNAIKAAANWIVKELRKTIDRHMKELRKAVDKQFKELKKKIDGMVAWVKARITELEKQITTLIKTQLAELEKIMKQMNIDTRTDIKKKVEDEINQLRNEIRGYFTQLPTQVTKHVLAQLMVRGEKIQGTPTPAKITVPAESRTNIMKMLHGAGYSADQDQVEAIYLGIVPARAFGRMPGIHANRLNWRRS